MKYSFILLTLFSSLPFLSRAQRNYKPGYVVNLQNDTLHGYIDYRGWENNPKAIRFKKNLDEPNPASFSTANAQAFGISGIEYYQRFIVKASVEQTSINHLTVGPDTSFQMDTAFLKVIIKGKNVSLFSLTDKIKTRFYIKDSRDNQTKELGYYVYYRTDDEVTTETIRTFRQQLIALAMYYQPQNTKIISKINYAHYWQSDLKNIVTLINGNRNQQIKQKNNFGIRYAAGLGVRSAKLALSGPEGAFPNGNSQNVSPVITAGIDILLNKNTGKIIFRTEAAFASFHYSTMEQPSILTTTTSIDFRQYTTSLTPQVFYNFYSANKFKIFLNAGLAFNFSSYNRYYFVRNFSEVSTIKTEGFPSFSKFWNSAVVKAGFVVSNKVEVYAGYSFGSSITQYIHFAAVSSFYQGGINYLFGK